MYKSKICIGVVLSTLLIVSLAHAGLTIIGTATYIGKDYNLIWDDDNNGNSVVWLDYSKFDEWTGVPDLSLKEMWVDSLDGNLSYNIDAAYDITWEADWRLANTFADYDTQNWDVSYDGSTQFGYNNTYNEMGHLFYEELGNSGEYDGSGNLVSGFGLTNTGDFENLHAYQYWTGTGFVEEMNYTFDFHTGLQYAADDTEHNYGLSLRNAQITISDLPPEIGITSPTTGSNYSGGETITFSGTATDNEDGNLSNLIEWSSNIDGFLGTGASLNSILSSGNHTITVSVTDSISQTSSDSVTITIIDDSPLEIDFDNLNFATYSNQGGSGTISIEDNGATLYMDGNNWVRTEETYIITADTVIDFDFMSTVEGEIHGIGFDEDDAPYNGRRIFELFGSSTFTSTGIQVTPQYTHSDLGTWVHYSIPVGQHYTGSNMHLVFVNDHDNAPADGNGWFRNVIVSEGTETNQPPTIITIISTLLLKGCQKKQANGECF